MPRRVRGGLAAEKLEHARAHALEVRKKGRVTGARHLDPASLREAARQGEPGRWRRDAIVLTAEHERGQPQCARERALIGALEKLEAGRECLGMCDPMLAEGMAQCRECRCGCGTAAHLQRQELRRPSSVDHAPAGRRTAAAWRAAAPCGQSSALTKRGVAAISTRRRDREAQRRARAASASCPPRDQPSSVAPRGTLAATPASSACCTSRGAAFQPLRPCPGRSIAVT